MVLESVKSRAVEFRIANDNSRRIDQRHTAGERAAGDVRERIGIRTGKPLGSYEASFAFKAVSVVSGDAVVQAIVDDCENGDNENDDENERIEPDPVRELHAPVRASSLKR